MINKDFCVLASIIFENVNDIWTSKVIGYGGNVTLKINIHLRT